MSEVEKSGGRLDAKFYLPEAIAHGSTQDGNSRTRRGMSKKTKTTLTVDEDVWREFRAQCIRRSTSASKLIQEFMRMSLKKWSVKEVEEEE